MGSSTALQAPPLNQTPGGQVALQVVSGLRPELQGRAGDRGAYLLPPLLAAQAPESPEAASPGLSPADGGPRAPPGSRIRITGAWNLHLTRSPGAEV